MQHVDVAETIIGLRRVMLTLDVGLTLHVLHIRVTRKTGSDDSSEGRVRDVGLESSLRLRCKECIMYLARFLFVNLSLDI